MAELIAIVGESGTGKTTSIRNLNPSEVFIISTTGKRPGIRGAKKKYPDVKLSSDGFTGNFYTTSNVDNIVWHNSTVKSLVNISGNMLMTQGSNILAMAIP